MNLHISQDEITISQDGITYLTRQDNILPDKITY